jgi:type I restriction enzyme M protein
MLTDTQLRSQVEALWDKLWSGGLSNPLDAIEQLSYLLFLRLETHTDPRDLTYDDEGWPHGLTGSRLSREEYDFCQREGFTAYDSDSGMTMLRIGSMNLMLHGLAAPRFHYADTLSKAFTEERAYDIVLANPPFKGAIDAADVNPTLPAKVKKTEILFLHLFLRLLENGGRAAVIVPDGVLFSSSNAHREIRRTLIEEHRLDGVVSMPSGVFRPYAGVSTAVLLFTKGAATERIWFYDMEDDGFSLDDKRQPTRGDNDIPDVLDCWHHRGDARFQRKRDARLAELLAQIAPLKKERLEHHALIHRLKFEEVVAQNDGDQARTAREKAEAELAELQTRIAPSRRRSTSSPGSFGSAKTRSSPRIMTSPPAATASLNRTRSPTSNPPSPSAGCGGWSRRRRPSSRHWRRCSSVHPVAAA